MKLSDVSGISLVVRKGQLMIKIVTKNNGRISLRKQEGLSDWFEQIVENGSTIKFQNGRRKLENSISLIENTSFLKDRQMPLMGCSSLTYGSR